MWAGLIERGVTDDCPLKACTQQFLAFSTNHPAFICFKQSYKTSHKASPLTVYKTAY